MSAHAQPDRPLALRVAGLTLAWLALGLAPAHADAPPGRYGFPVEGTVNDTKTKLTWQRMVDMTQRTNAQALSYCTALPLAGAGWRLPTRAELSSLVDHTRRGPSIDPVAFPDTPAALFWTSTRYVNELGALWHVWFDEGATYHNPSSTLMFVRCVRATK
jgi:hypothetical protein